MREDWIEIELGKVCDYSKGKKPKLLTREFSDITPYPYVNIKVFEKGIFEKYTDGKKCNLCEEGDLLMVWDGARAGLTGKAKKGAVGSTLMKIEPKNGIERNYLFYFLLSLYKKLNTNPRGVGIPHVEPGLLWNSVVLIPDMPTQRAIVTKIENLFISIDKGIADLKKAQEQLKVYRQAVLKKAFEGSLTNKNIKEGELPAGWKWIKLGEVIEKPKYGTSKKCTYKETGIGVLRIPNIVNGLVDSTDLKYAEFSEEEIDAYSLKEGDILIIRSNGSISIVGKCAIINKQDEKFLYAGYLIRLRPVKEKINSIYLLYLLASFDLRVQIELKSKSTSGVNNINSGEIQSMIIALPSKGEQHQIIAEIESRLSVCDKVEQSISEGLEKSEALRQSILKKAFEGKLLSEAEIEQCKQEADYEPADVLLEKIKKERK